MVTNIAENIDPSDPYGPSSKAANFQTTSPSSRDAANFTYNVPSLQELVYECYIDSMNKEFISHKVSHNIPNNNNISISTSSSSSSRRSSATSSHSISSSVSTNDTTTTGISFKSNMFNSNINLKYQEYFSSKNFVKFIKKSHCFENIQFLIMIQKYEKLWNELFHLNSNCLSCKKRVSTIMINPDGSGINLLYNNAKRRSISVQQNNKQNNSFSSNHSNSINSIEFTIHSNHSNSTLSDLNKSNISTANVNGGSNTPLARTLTNNSITLSRSSPASQLTDLNLELNNNLQDLSNLDSFVNTAMNKSTLNSQSCNTENSTSSQWFEEPAALDNKPIPNSFTSSQSPHKHKLDHIDYTTHFHTQHCQCEDQESNDFNTALNHVNDLYLYIIDQFITEDSELQISLPCKIQLDLINDSKLIDGKHNPNILLGAKEYVMSLLSQNVYKNFIAECETKIEQDKHRSSINTFASFNNTPFKGPCGVLNPEIIQPIRGPCGITNPEIAQPMSTNKQIRRNSKLNSGEANTNSLSSNKHSLTSGTKERKLKSKKSSHHHYNKFMNILHSHTEVDEESHADDPSVTHNHTQTTTKSKAHHEKQTQTLRPRHHHHTFSSSLGLKSLKSRIIRPPSGSDNSSLPATSTSIPSSGSSTGLFRSRKRANTATSNSSSISMKSPVSTNSRNRRLSSSSSSSSVFSSRHTSPLINPANSNLPVINDTMFKLSNLSLNNSTHSSANVTHQGLGPSSSGSSGSHAGHYHHDSHDMHHAQSQ